MDRSTLRLNSQLNRRKPKNSLVAFTPPVSPLPGPRVPSMRHVSKMSTVPRLAVSSLLMSAVPSLTVSALLTHNTHIFCRTSSSTSASSLHEKTQSALLTSESGCSNARLHCTGLECVCLEKQEEHHLVRPSLCTNAPGGFDASTSPRMLRCGRPSRPLLRLRLSGVVGAPTSLLSTRHCNSEKTSRTSSPGPRVPSMRRQYM